MEMDNSLPSHSYFYGDKAAVNNPVNNQQVRLVDEQISRLKTSDLHQKSIIIAQ
jgi:hypothetical protein